MRRAKLSFLATASIASVAALAHAEPPKAVAAQPAAAQANAQPKPHDKEKTANNTASDNVTWSFLKMNHPDLVVTMLKNVQAGKAPASSVEGISTPAATAEILKKNWAGVATNQPKSDKPTTAGAASMTWHATTQSNLASMVAVLADPNNQTLGYSVFGHGKQTHSVWIECPEDGQVTATTKGNDDFKVGKIADYDGTFTGNDMKQWEARDNAPFKLSVKAGQWIKVAVEFEVKNGEKAGTVKGTLDVQGAGWSKAVALEGEIKGLSGSLLFDQEKDVFVVADRQGANNLTVDIPVLVKNDSQAFTGQITQKQMPPGVTLANPVSFSIGAKENKTVKIPLVINPRSVPLGWQTAKFDLKAPGFTSMIWFDFDALQSIKRYTWNTSDDPVNSIKMVLALSANGANAFGYSMKMDGPKFFVHTQGSATIKGFRWDDEHTSIPWSPGSAAAWNEYLNSNVSFSYKFGYINPIWPF